jgi:hypothetical protein
MDGGRESIESMEEGRREKKLKKTSASQKSKWRTKVKLSKTKVEKSRMDRVETEGNE